MARISFSRARPPPRPPPQSYTLCGPPGYWAPEMLTGDGYVQGVDYWQLGVLLFELLTGEEPLRGPTVAAVKEAIADYENAATLGWPGEAVCSLDCRSFLSGLLTPIPKVRLGARLGTVEGKSHRWLRKEEWGGGGREGGKEVVSPLYPVVQAWLSRVGGREDEVQKEVDEAWERVMGREGGEGEALKRCWL